MQAIITKYLPATNFKGSRIRAKCDRGSILISYPHELSGEAVHLYAARELVKRFAAQDFNQYKTPPEKILGSSQRFAAAYLMARSLMYSRANSPKRAP